MWLTETPDEEMFGNQNLTQLDVDGYYIKFINSNNEFGLYARYEDCYKCPYTRVPTFQDHYEHFKSYPIQEWRVLNTRDINMENYLSLDGSDENVRCSLTPDVGEFGVYEFNMGFCELTPLLRPVNIYAGFLTVLLIASLFIFAGYLVSWIKKLVKKNIHIKENDVSQNINVPKKQRVQSLDTFRGISIVIMIFVNYGGGHYDFFEHAPWNGLHVADLVFPWFMWIMGVCIPISVNSKRKKCTYLNILRRSCILFMLGLFLNHGLYFSTLRIFGVLQRFAICYLFVASLQLLFSKCKIPELQSRFGKIFNDIFTLLPQWIIILIIMTTHLVITFLLEVPDCPTGYLGPGGLHENGLYYNCTGGAAGYIDRQILGLNHVYQKPTFSGIYKSNIPFDPEGLFATLMSIVQVFIGVQAGTTMLTFKSHKDRLIRWSLWGIFCGLIAGILCNFSKEEGVIPINKNLWSLSFVLVTSCFAFILLSLCYIAIDIFHLWAGKPFLFAGMNATIMYVGHSLSYAFPFLWAIEPMNTHYLHLASAVWGTSLWVLIAYWLFRIKFFLTI